MNATDCNRVITEFMGDRLSECPTCKAGDLPWQPNYSESLDALKPVWSKMGHETYVEIYLTHDGAFDVDVTHPDLRRPVSFHSDHVSEAAAAATARAILEITYDSDLV